MRREKYAALELITTFYNFGSLSMPMRNQLEQEFNFMIREIEQLEEIVADRTKDVMYYKEKFESLEGQLEKERNRFSRDRKHYQKTMSWAENKIAELEEKLNNQQLRTTYLE